MCFLSTDLFAQDCPEGIFEKVPVPCWEGRTMLFLDNSYTADLEAKMQLPIGSLVGKQIEITSVSANPVWTVAGHIPSLNKSYSFKLYGSNKAVEPIVASLTLASDFSNAISYYKDRNIYLKWGIVYTYTDIIKVGIQDPVKVYDITLSGDPLMPTRMWLTANGDSGYVDVNMSGTNLGTKSPGLYHFDSMFYHDIQDTKGLGGLVPNNIRCQYTETARVIDHLKLTLGYVSWTKDRNCYNFKNRYQWSASTAVWNSKLNAYEITDVFGRTILYVEVDKRDLLWYTILDLTLNDALFHAIDPYSGITANSVFIPGVTPIGHKTPKTITNEPTVFIVDNSFYRGSIR